MNAIEQLYCTLATQKSWRWNRNAVAGAQGLLAVLPVAVKALLTNGRQQVVLASVPSVAVDTDGSLLTVYEIHDLPAGQQSQLMLPGAPRLAPSTTSNAIPSAGDVGITDVLPAPEIIFSRGIFFPYEDAAPSGSTQTAFAQVQNTGIKSDQVKIEYLKLNGANPPTVLGSQTITLVYGTDGGASATVGVQSKQGLSTSEWTCDTGADDSVTAGLRIVATHHEGQPPVN